jgi:hypothetical protein
MEVELPSLSPFLARVLSSSLYTKWRRPVTREARNELAFGSQPRTLRETHLSTLVRKTTVYGLGCIRTPETKLGAWDISVHGRPGLSLRADIQSLSDCLDVTVVLRTSRKELERQHILEFGNVHGQVRIGFPVLGRFGLSNLINNNCDVIIEPCRRKPLLPGYKGDRLLNRLVRASVIRRDDDINILC